MTGCAVCSKPLSAVNRSGYCRKHFGTTNSASTTRQNLLHWADPEFRLKHVGAIRALNRRRVEWCPLEYRDDYRFLKRVKHYSAAQARQMIEDRIASDQRRYALTGRLQRTAG